MNKIEVFIGCNYIISDDSLLLGISKVIDTTNFAYCIDAIHYVSMETSTIWGCQVGLIDYNFFCKELL